MTEIFQPLIDRYMSNINYRGIGLLMTIESSFIPFPSEIVVPPAWRKVAQGLLNWWLVMIVATVGALLWALINYYLALWLGRKIVYKLVDTKWAHMILLNKESVQKAENYFCKHGKISTFIGRLIPAIRQLISLPAGLAKMPIGSFIAYTCLGAGLWNLILFIAGYVLGQHWDKVIEYNHIFKIVIYAIIAIILGYLVIRYRLRRQKKKIR